MMTSSNGDIFRVNGPLGGEFSDHWWIPLINASDGSFGVFFDLRLNKHLRRRIDMIWKAIAPIMTSL